MTLGSALRSFTSAPYTVLVSVVLGLFLAPAVLALWNFAERQYDRANPVVRVQAEVIERADDAMVVWLHGEKLRDCEYLNLYVYGRDVDGVLHDVYRTRTDGETSRTRPVGKHSFGEWKLWPMRWPVIELYTKHNCDGRVVLTKIAELQTPAP